jgi:hypothetical protein
MDNQFEDLNNDAMVPFIPDAATRSVGDNSLITKPADVATTTVTLCDTVADGTGSSFSLILESEGTASSRRFLSAPNDALFSPYSSRSLTRSSFSRYIACPITSEYITVQTYDMRHFRLTQKDTEMKQEIAAITVVYPVAPSAEDVKKISAAMEAQLRQIYVSNKGSKELYDKAKFCFTASGHEQCAKNVCDTIAGLYHEVKQTIDKRV